MSKKVLIGGLPSSGSTLLSFLLDSHHSISCGPEFGLFCHPFFWNEKNKNIWQDVLISKISNKNISKVDTKYKIKEGFIEHNSIIDSDPKDLEWYGTSLNEIIKLIKKSNNGPDFFYEFSEKIIKKKDSIVFCEKSPPNIFSIKYFLNTISNSTAFVCIRNPIDTISSLMKRNLTFHTALSIWLYEANLISTFLKDPKIKIIKYELLITSPIKIMDDLFLWLGITLDSKEIITQNNKNKCLSKRSSNPREFITSWKNKPFEKIDSKNILHGLKEMKNYEIMSLRCIKLNENSFSNQNEKSFVDILNLFEYSQEDYLPILDLKFKEILFFLKYIFKLKKYFKNTIFRDLHKSSVKVSNKLILNNLFLIFYKKIINLKKFFSTNRI